MQIRNYSKISYKNIEHQRTLPELKQSVESKNSFASMSIVSPAYFSPSFMGIGYEDDGIICPKNHAQKEFTTFLRFDSKMNNPDYIFSGEERDEWLNYYLANTGYLDKKLSNVYRLPGTKNSYRGQTLRNKGDETFGNLVESGIKTIIDFSSISDFGSTRYMSEKHGIEYVPFSVVDFLNQENIDISRDTIDNLTNYIAKMREDNVYACCLYGKDETKIGLMVNNWFNPDIDTNNPGCYSPAMCDIITDIYNTLTNEDKAKMGWTKEYEAKFEDMLHEQQLREFGITL